MICLEQLPSAVPAVQDQPASVNKAAVERAHVLQGKVAQVGWNEPLLSIEAVCGFFAREK